MKLASFFRELYSLDTLDTRFTNSATTPLKADGQKATATATTTTNPDSKLPPGTSPPKWNTPEFYFYLVVFLICVPQMYWAVAEVSLQSSPHYETYQHLLSDGWLLGRKVDNSDNQYATFRENVPYLALLLVVQPLLRRAYERFSGIPKSSSTSSNGSVKPSVPAAIAAAARARRRLDSRLTFDFFFGLVFISALHGFAALKVLLILYINFLLATRLPRKYIPPATWIFNISTLFANELARGYPFATVASTLLPFSPAAVEAGRFLDAHCGLMSRWEVLFNITVLRLISFNLDYYWSLNSAGSRSASPIEKKQLDPSALSERDRVTTPAPADLFTSLPTYLAYVLYSPLYLAGPILTFNDYISQSSYPARSLSARRTTLYGIRFLLVLFCMEFVLHTIYVVAISKANPDWSTYTPFQLSMLAYFNLHIIWLKLLIPWRFFRLWALIDGIDPPENMVRCMSDNYSGLAFWRSWHRSYNRWIILAGLAFPAKAWRDRPTAYRVICGIGAVANVFMMMTANLVGFALGLDGLKGLVQGIVGSWQGAVFLLTACSALFVGVQVMFEHREDEKRKGIRMRC
ncbi:hypothetical protein DV735_g1139, partial [Chaetothyriales sp. CBS 134920]